MLDLANMQLVSGRTGTSMRPLNGFLFARPFRSKEIGVRVASAFATTAVSAIDALECVVGDDDVPAGSWIYLSGTYRVAEWAKRQLTLPGYGVGVVVPKSVVMFVGPKPPDEKSE